MGHEARIDSEKDEARSEAGRWWEQTGKSEAMCDKCGRDLENTEGYIITLSDSLPGGYACKLLQGADLRCENCFDTMHRYVHAASSHAMTSNWSECTVCGKTGDELYERPTYCKSKAKEERRNEQATRDLIEAFDNAPVTHWDEDEDKLLALCLAKIEQGADIDALDKEGWTPLMHAAGKGYEKVLPLLLERGADVNKQASSTPLISAMWKHGGIPEIVSTLISKGADVNAVGAHDLTALMRAARYGHKWAVSFLIENGAGVDSITDEGASALHFAALEGHSEVAQLLLKGGCNPNRATTDVARITPLQRAVMERHIDVVRVLLEHGADVDATNSADLAALNIAAENGPPAIVELLLTHGARIDIQSSVTGATPLSGACQNAQANILDLLLEHGADADFVGPNGFTPLFQAVEYGTPGMVRSLIQRGADVNAVVEGCTPLHLAAMFGKNETAQLLIEHEANRMLRYQGETPADLARSSGHHDLASSIVRGRSKKERAADLVAEEKRKLDRKKQQDRNKARLLAIMFMIAIVLSVGWCVR